MFFRAVFCALLLGSFTANLFSQTVDSDLPIKKIVILTSGLAYYQRSGEINGAARITLPFRLNAVNDALKTLIVNDAASANPSITYQAENTLIQTLRGLAIDLSDNPGMADILARLKGAEVEISSPNPTRGRIAGIENRRITIDNKVETNPWLLINSSVGMRLFNLSEISSIKFLDPAIERDLTRALDLIASSRNSLSRQLSVNLPGTGRRNVSVSYVIPSPVWKVSYRLDLGASKPLFQGWAIVDNDSDTDWNNVQLSLVAGRPVSFIQELYPPYYVSRPTLPLSIAGTASAQAHDRSYVTSDNMVMMESSEMVMKSSAPMAARQREEVVAGGAVQTAAGSDAGGQFEFTIKNSVSLDRRMSAMYPLVESEIQARGVLIYSGTGRYPRLGAELTNTSRMKLPAGPITVYDGGVYAGDALIEFWNENEKRLISFGEDLSVTASSGSTSANAVSSVVISEGVMTINRSVTYNRTYTFINSGAASKQLIVEHNKTSQTDLVSPRADEQTTSAYRFNVTLPPGRESVLTVSERRPTSERITLVSSALNSIVSYSTNQEIPANARQALARAVELRRAYEAIDANIKTIETQRERLVSDQDRVRRNLEAAGNQTQQGQEYLRRLVSIDSEIDALDSSLEKERASALAARKTYESYIAGLNLR